MSYFFNPYMMGYNANRFKGVHRLDFGGIPFVRTSSVTTDTTNSEVIYGSELLTPKGMSFFLFLPVIAFYDSPQA